MQLKEQLTSKKTRSILIGVILLGCAGLLIAYETGATRLGGPGKMFVSCDDGATFETDSIKQFPPYTSDGKDYVRAFVFNDGSKQFVGYLMKFSDDTRQRLMTAQDKLGAAVVNCDSTGKGCEVFVKRPGEHDWSPLSSPKGLEIESIKDGLETALQPLTP